MRQKHMKAMILRKIVDLKHTDRPLDPAQVPLPEVHGREILIRVSACGVCHTELDEIEGRTPPPRLPVIPGHQVVGKVVALGAAVRERRIGERVGVAWIFSACGHCTYCLSGQENLCRHFKATGRDAPGGYAEFMKIDEAFAHPIPAEIEDVQAAPLLCAGAVGYRSLSLTGVQNGQALGLTGFGASGHLVLKLARYQYPASPIYVFARSERERHFALELGADWAGAAEDTPPRALQAIIDTTPAWTPVIAAMGHLAPGGRLVINAIRKEDFDRESLLTLNYGDHLWHEKEIKSVANVTRGDVREFLAIAGRAAIRPEVSVFPLSGANEALMELKQRHIRGAKVLVMEDL